MKKALNVILAATTAFAMLTSAAYITAPEKAEESQLQLTSVRAVDIQTAISGVRSYSDLADSTHVYQVNDPIYLAVTVDVRNIEKSKYSKLKSIEDKNIDVVVGSSHVDLQYAKYNTPCVLSHIYSGVNESNVATVSTVMNNVGSILEYDKDKNEVKFTFRGYQMNAANVNSTNGTISVAAVQEGGKIMIPALRIKDGKNTLKFGTTNYTYDFTAPDTLSYTMVVMGVCKDNAGAQTGDFYARIMISGAEKFEDYKSYNIDVNGNMINDLTGKENYVDYVTVKISKLELASGYNVYKYFVPANAMLNTEVPVIYDKEGENKDYRGDTLARVNTSKYDNATNKKDTTIGVTNVWTAGGVNSVKGYTQFDASGEPTGTQVDIPVTSAIYTSQKTIYAPAFYGVDGTKGSGKYFYFDQYDIGTKGTNYNISFVETRVEYWETPDISAAEANALEIVVYDAGALTAAISATTGDLDRVAALYDNIVTTGSAVVKKDQYTITRTNLVNGKCTIKVTPKSQDVYPLDWAHPSNDKSRQNWVVVCMNYDNQTGVQYQDPNNGVTSTPPTGALTTADYTAGVAVATGRVPVPQTMNAKYCKDASNGTLTTKAIKDCGLVLGEHSKDYPVTKKLTNGIYIPLEEHENDPAFKGKNYKFTKADIQSVKIGNRDKAKTGNLDKDWLVGEYAESFSKEVMTNNITADYLWTVSADGKGVIIVPNTEKAVTPTWADRWFDGVSAAEATTSGVLATGTHADYRMASIVYSIEEGAGMSRTQYRANSTLMNDIVDRNGISVYVICNNSDDKPYVSVATETTYFDSQDGYTIALFDGYNFDKYSTRDGVQYPAVGERIYRSNDSNLAYSVIGTHVEGSSTIIKALQFFGLDTSFNTTYRVTDETFEVKGAGAVYSDDITGKFNYGTVEIYPDQVDEATEEDNADDDQPADDVDDTEDEGDVDEDEPADDDNSAEDDVTPDAPPTGDASGNVAIALTASALLAAAGLVVVMRKAR